MTTQSRCGTPRASLFAGLLTVAAVGLSVGAGPASAVETIKLTAVSGYPPVTSWVKVFKDHFMAGVDQRLAAGGKYKIAWNEGFAGTIVKPRGELEGVQTGLGDIGVVIPPFHADKVPLYSVSFVTPFVTNDLSLMVKAYQKLARDFPQFNDQWTRFNQVAIGVGGAVDDYVIVSKPKIASFGDLKGKKIASAGLNLRWIEGSGAAPINSNLTAYFNDLKSGVVDGVIVWPEAAGNFKLGEVAPHMLRAGMGAALSFEITVNRDTWNRLPEEVRKVFREVGATYGEALATHIKTQTADGLEKFKAQGGSVMDLPADQRKQWAAGLPDIAGQWADEMDGKKLPGRAILTNYMDFMRANNQPVLRHWDRK
jgi:TRAP-type C4-dicarboxylate transport system substrate-binding protein